MNEFLTKRVVKATFDATEGKATGAHGLGVVIPKNAIIVNAFYDVTTTFADGASDTATIALSILAANDLVSAVAISAAGDVYDSGIRGTLIDAPALGADAAHDTAIEVAALKAATYKKLTANKELTATVAVAALTAGVLDLYVEYVI